MPTDDPGRRLRQQKSRMWRQLRDRGVSPADATIQVEQHFAGPFADVQGGASTQAPPPVAATPSEVVSPALTVGRAAGLTGTGLRQGVRQALNLGELLSGGPGMAPDVLRRQMTGQGFGETVVPDLGLPEPQTPGERTYVGGVAGGVGGAPFGPMGALSGFLGGAGAQGATELGMGPVGAGITGLLAGLIPGGAIHAIRSRIGAAAPALKAARLVRSLERANAQPALSSLPRAGVEAPGIEQMGRVGRSIGLDVARQGGTPADDLAAFAERRLAQRAQQVQGMETAAAQEATGATTTADEQIAALRSAAMQETQRLGAAADQAAAGERAAAAAGERLARQAAQEEYRVAQRAAAGDRVATALERHTGLPSGVTLKEAEASAERELKRVGVQVFDPLDAHGVLRPSAQTAPVFDVLGDPQVRAAWRSFGTPSAHPTVESLRKTYQLLGAQARAAAKNGGFLKVGRQNVLMRDFWEARDRLGAALEQAVPGFKEANTAYRAASAVSDGLAEGALGGQRGIAQDMATRMQALGALNPDAQHAYRFAMARTIADRWRQLPSNRAVAQKVTALGSGARDRLRLAFPDEAAFAAFQQEMEPLGARATPTVAERLRPETVIRQQRQAIETAARNRAAAAEAASRAAHVTEQERQIAQDLAAQRAAIADRLGIAKAGLPAEPVRLAKELQTAARGLEQGGLRDLERAGTEMTTLPRRGVVDLLRALLHRKPSLKTRRVLTDLLTAEGPQAGEEADRMRRALESYLGRRRGVLAGATIGGISGGLLGD